MDHFQRLRRQRQGSQFAAVSEERGQLAGQVRDAEKAYHSSGGVHHPCAPSMIVPFCTEPRSNQGLMNFRLLLAIRTQAQRRRTVLVSDRDHRELNGVHGSCISPTSST